MKKNWIYSIGTAFIAAMLAIGGIFAMPESPTAETTIPTEVSMQSVATTEVPTESTISTTERTEPSLEQTQPPETSVEPVLKVLMWPETIARGDTGTVTIQGKPDTTYTIKVYYKSGPSTSKALADQVSDADGFVTWTWKVSKNAKPGDFKIIVSGGGEMIELPFSVTE